MTNRRSTSSTPIWIGIIAVVVIVGGLILTRDSATPTEPANTEAATADSEPLTRPPTTVRLPSLEDVPPAVRAALLSPTACDAAAPTSFAEMQFVAPVDQGVDGPLSAVLHTSCGDVTIELDPSISPLSVNSFVFLANEGYFQGQIVHRLVTNFVFQGGDPTGTGTGGPGYTIQDEFPPIGTAYPVGTVAMAKSGLPNSTGSQFFIVLADAPHLGSQDGLMFNILGHVTEGFEVLEAINALEVAGPAPVQSLYLEGVDILP
jgi:peptidyl-prolyl cis-trans isomerase B (cyclophilin B)